MRKSFIVHIDSLDVLDDLTNEQCGELFRAIKAHQTGVQIELSPVAKIAFSPFRSQFDRDDEKYSETCKRRADAGSKGGKQKAANVASASNSYQTVANVADSVSKSDSKSKSVSKSKEIVIPDGINLSAWNEWVAYRKTKKKTVSQAAAKKQFKLLSNYSTSDQQLVIDNSISNDYQGLFELKGNSNGQHQQPLAQGQTKRQAALRQCDEDLANLRRAAEQSHSQSGGVLVDDGKDVRGYLDQPAWVNNGS